MTAETVTIILPLPPSCLSCNRPPGSIGGRMKRAAATKRYLKLAREATEQQRIESGPWVRATVSAVFFHKQARRRDDVNHLGMLKAAYDGVVEAGLLVDDDSTHLTTLPAVFLIDKALSRVELTFERVRTERAIA